MGVGYSQAHNMQSSQYGGGSGNNSFNKGNIKKTKGGAKQNGMLAALHPSGTIHVSGGGGSGNHAGMLTTDFKMTMKHNSSNHSI